MSYRSGVSLFAGMDRSVLEAQLQAAQLALIELQSGRSNVSLAYAQGDGSKSITRKVGSVAECTALIQQLQQVLGINPRPRRSIRFIHR
jgi:hypothetical protein